MHLDIISDPICPWCYVGKKRMEIAIAARPQMQIDLAYRVFQLNPDMPREGMDRKEHMRRKFGESKGPSPIMKALIDAGRELGIDFNFSRIARTPNTQDAHRLIRWSHSTGHQPELVEIMFRRYFTDGDDISDHSVLLDIAREAGMDTGIIGGLLAGDADRDLILAEDATARRIGIQGVPSYVLANKYLLVGAQEPELLLRALDMAFAESRQAAAS
ncbi:MAG: DsbA family oxidoreductase [Alphaproteobacteria bacterium]|nr:DsbA family oxidoreductase [Alphaproteobacteria bacterium]